jgi:hypothetical protein
MDGGVDVVRFTRWCRIQAAVVKKLFPSIGKREVGTGYSSVQSSHVLGAEE